MAAQPVRRRRTPTLLRHQRLSQLSRPRTMRSLRQTSRRILRSSDLRNNPYGTLLLRQEGFLLSVRDLTVPDAIRSLTFLPYETPLIMRASFCDLTSSPTMTEKPFLPEKHLQLLARIRVIL